MPELTYETAWVIVWKYFKLQSQPNSIKKKYERKSKFKNLFLAI